MDQDKQVDPGRPAARNAFDHADGFSGQDYNRNREAAEGARLPSGTVNLGGEGGDGGLADVPDNGRRASFDPQTGEVHGSGAGAGGGNAGEDFDSDTKSGAADTPSGAGAGTDPHDLGPPHFKD